MGAHYTVFDGHNDTLLKLELGKADANSTPFFEGAPDCHIDLPRARKGGFGGGFFAMWVPSTLEDTDFSKFNPLDPVNYAPIDQQDALRFTNKMVARARRMERGGQGQVAIVRSVADIEQAVGKGKLAILLHIEGAEAIDADMHSLEVLYAAGLRSLGPVWSRDNIFAHGVPMGFPGSPDTGPGLTKVGEELVRACNDLGIMIDLSHLNEKGFWDVARLTDAPLVATHSNVHALCPSPRNLTDKQLDAIAESKGVVGLNFHVAFLNPDGSRNPDISLDIAINHLRYLVEKLGEDGVAIGSDYDGCVVPSPIADVAGLPALTEAMEKAQFGRELIEKICFHNWMGVLSRTLKDA